MAQEKRKERGLAVCACVTAILPFLASKRAANTLNRMGLC